MEKIEEGQQNIESEKLAQFREEMKKLAEEEIGSVHFRGLNPADLDERDMEIWNDFKNFKKGQDFGALKSRFENHKSTLSYKPEEASRSRFSAMLANKLNTLMFELDLE